MGSISNQNTGTKQASFPEEMIIFQEPLNTLGIWDKIKFLSR